MTPLYVKIGKSHINMLALSKVQETEHNGKHAYVLYYAGSPDAGKIEVYEDVGVEAIKRALNKLE